MKTAVIFIFYLVLFSFLLFVSLKKGDKKLILWVFSPFYLKIAIGIGYGLFFRMIIPNADTWNYHYNGLNILNNILKNDLEVHINPRGKNLNLLSSSSYFEYYRYAIMDYMSALFSFLSGGRYYVNLIFYNWIVYLGLIKLYRFVCKINRDYNTIFYWLIFYFPPFLFWTSGFHRDGLCIASLGAGLYYFQLLLEKFNFHRFIQFSIFVLLLLFMRSFWGFSLIIVTTIWWTSQYFKKINPLKIFTFGLIVFLLLYFLTGLFPDYFNFPKNLVSKQYAFNSLEGKSKMILDSLTSNPTSYLRAGLQGINHLTLRPYISEISGSFLYFLTFFDNLIVWSLFIFSIKFYYKNGACFILKRKGNLVLISLVLINYIVIGLTVPFLGAIVRYKAPFELLLILLLIQIIPSYIMNRYITKRLQTPKSLFLY